MLCIVGYTSNCRKKKVKQKHVSKAHHKDQRRTQSKMYLASVDAEERTRDAEKLENGLKSIFFCVVRNLHIL